MRFAVSQKVGMSSFFSNSYEFTPTTILRTPESLVFGYRTELKDGYKAVQIAFGKSPKGRQAMKKPQAQEFLKRSVEPRRFIKEFRLDSTEFIEDLPPSGSSVDFSDFSVGDLVKIRSTSKGRGFSGAMKRHNFAGLEATHGVSVSHRSHGSTGNRTDPGKVFKGKKMAGQYGNTVVFVKNLRVMYKSDDNSMIALSGSVPGPCDAYVFIERVI